MGIQAFDDIDEHDPVPIELIDDSEPVYKRRFSY